MGLLDANIVEQLKAYFGKIEGTIELNAFLDESDKSKELDSFLQEVDSISEKVNYKKETFGVNKELEEKLEITRPTSFALTKNGEKTGINIYGIPGGHEFNSFILAVLGLAGLGKKLEGEQLTKIESVNKPLNIETFVSLSCTKCPEVVQALNVISMANENITTSLIDGGVYPEEVKSKNIQGVPVVFINGEQASVGEKTMEELINFAGAEDEQPGHDQDGQVDPGVLESQDHGDGRCQRQEGGQGAQAAEQAARPVGARPDLGRGEGLRRRGSGAAG